MTIPWSSTMTDCGPTYQFTFEPYICYLSKSLGCSSPEKLETQEKRCYCPSHWMVLHWKRICLIYWPVSNFVMNKQLIHRHSSYQPLFLNSKFQSREQCFPFKIGFANDSKKAYHEVMKEFFTFMKQLRKLGLPESQYCPALHPFDVMRSPQQDMLSQ